MKKMFKLVSIVFIACLFLYFGAAIAEKNDHQPYEEQKAEYIGRIYDAAINGKIFEAKEVYQEYERVLGKEDDRNTEKAADVLVQEEIYKIVAGTGGVKGNYERAKIESEKTQEKYFVGPDETRAFANAQAKFIVAAAKVGKAGEAKRVYRAAHRGGVANKNVYLANDLAKKITQKKKRMWFGLF